MRRIITRLVALSGLAALIAALLSRRCDCCAAGTVQWPGVVQWGADGSLVNVAAFNAHLGTAKPCYRHYPEAAAQALLGMDPNGASPQPAFTLEYGPSAGSGETDVTISFETPDDDSVAATRYRLTFVDEGYVGGTDGVHRLVQGVREVRCHPGRGHTDWSSDLCL